MGLTRGGGFSALRRAAALSRRVRACASRVSDFAPNHNSLSLPSKRQPMRHNAPPPKARRPSKARHNREFCAVFPAGSGFAPRQAVSVRGSRLGPLGSMVSAVSKRLIFDTQTNKLRKAHLPAEDSAHLIFFMKTMVAVCQDRQQSIATGQLEAGTGIEPVYMDLQSSA